MNRVNDNLIRLYRDVRGQCSAPHNLVVECVELVATRISLYEMSYYYMKILMRCIRVVKHIFWSIPKAVA